MGRLSFVAVLLCLSGGALMTVVAEDPYLYFDWNFTYGTVYPLGVPQQAILINGQFPGPKINCTSNNNIVVNVFNNLDEPFLLSWNGIQQRKNSWLDGTPGTMCPISPGNNFTFKIQIKDQIGSFFYYPSIGLQKAAGGIGPLNVHSRELIPVPFDRPADEFNVLMGDVYSKGHKALQRTLDGGEAVGAPDGVHINGKSAKVGDKMEPFSTMEPGKTYQYRVCNIGLKTSLNFRIQGHSLRLVEVEGSHVIQNYYDSIDVHTGQCLSVLVTADKEPKDYYMVVSSRFSDHDVESVAIIHYANGNGSASPDLPPPPPGDKQGIEWSINQFRSFRRELTASAARPNPQGSYHYGLVKSDRKFFLSNGEARVDGKLRYTINNVSHIDTKTPLKLAEYFGIADKEFKYDVMEDVPSENTTKVIVAPNVVNATIRNYIEIIFENNEDTMQTWNLNGYAFFAVAIETGKWSPLKRENYNLIDAVSKHNIQVYPKSWAAVMTALDNPGMWNLRSGMADKAYLGQQLYLSIINVERRVKYEYDLPETQQLCGAVVGLPKPEPYSIDAPKSKKEEPAEEPSEEPKEEES